MTADYLAVELQGHDPIEIAELWGHVTDLPVTRDGAVLSMALNNVALRFVEATDGRGPGLGGIDLAVRDRDRILAAAKARNCYVSDDRVDVCGVRLDAPGRLTGESVRCDSSVIARDRRRPPHSPVGGRFP